MRQIIFIPLTNYTPEALASKYFVATGKKRSQDERAFLEWCFEENYYAKGEVERGSEPEEK